MILYSPVAASFARLEKVSKVMVFLNFAKRLGAEARYGRIDPTIACRLIIKSVGARASSEVVIAHVLCVDLALILREHAALLGKCVLPLLCDESEEPQRMALDALLEWACNDGVLCEDGLTKQKSMRRRCRAGLRSVGALLAV